MKRFMHKSKIIVNATIRNQLLLINPIDFQPLKSPGNQLKILYRVEQDAGWFTI